MTRRWFARVNGLVLGTIFVTTAWGQGSTERTSLAERMAALRRGWTQEQAATTTEQSPSADAAAPENRSLLPKWLGRRGEQPATQPTGQPSRSSARVVGSEGSQAGQSPAGASGRPQAPTPPRAGSVQSTVASPNRGALPGLGGSRLPNGNRTPSQNSATTRSDVPGDVASDYPVIRDVSPNNKTGQSVGQQPGTSSSTAAVRPSPPRHSPGRHTAPYIDPEELRRELAGGFPGAAAKSGPAARTARIDEPAIAADGEVAHEASNEPAPQETAPADMPRILPTIEQSPAPINRAAPVTAKTASPLAAPRSNDNSSPAATEMIGSGPKLRSSFGSGTFLRTPQMSTLPAGSPTILGREAFGDALQVANGGDPSVLVSNQTPVIATDIRGPKQIMIGREATYRVRLQNQGAAAAEGIVASIRIPPWADVIDTTATQGVIQPSQNAATPTQLEWQLARLDGRATETLDIRLVPRESRPLELGLSWTLAPVGSRAIVEVQEPKLKIEVAGPNEVLYDKPQVFRLTLSNPGTGPAENVKVELIPPGGGQQEATNHPLGDLPPGASKTVEIELTAREAGKLMVKAVASAEGGLTSDVAKEIFCRKPELELDWRGPATKYAGTAATYFFRVRNPGTAPAEDVTVLVTLPEGAEFTSGSEGQEFDAQRREVTWRVGTLEPGDDNYMELKCVVKTPGVNHIKVTAATSSGDLAESETAETNVVALADLKLEVSDPSGPVAVGSQAVYEIRVTNRGSSTAKDVNIVALFSEGIEPDQAEGAMSTVADGRVSFRAIEELPAGREITLRIRAHAVQPGTHVFRAEVLCRDAEIKLAAEETTRFYADDVLPDSEEPEQQQAASRNGFEAAVR